VNFFQDSFGTLALHDTALCAFYVNVLAHPLNIITHSKTHLIRLAAGLCSDPLGGELTALARPQLLATENRF